MKLNIMWFSFETTLRFFFVPGERAYTFMFRFSDISCWSIKITTSQVLPENRMKDLISLSLSEVSNGCYGPTSVKMQLEHDNPLINPNSVTLMFHFRFRTLYLSGRSLECLQLWNLWVSFGCLNELDTKAYFFLKKMQKLTNLMKSAMIYYKSKESCTQRF